MFSVQPLSERSAGRLIRADGGTSLRDLPFDSIAEEFRTSGALLFRDFDVAPSDFAEFTDRFSSSTLGRFHGGQNRRAVADSAATSTVNLGNQLVGPHAELAYSPRRPDLLWFYCVCPPASGGETTLFDGIEVWEALPAALRDAFAANDLRYSFAGTEPDTWPLFTGERADRARTAELLGAERNVSHALRDDVAIDISYRVPAATPTKFQGVPAFANSIIPTDSDDVAFADGAPLQSSTRLSILRTCNALMTRVPWQKNDILMIDNSRMMHGRMPFSDSAREIHVRMSMAAFA